MATSRRDKAAKPRASAPGPTGPVTPRLIIIEETEHSDLPRSASAEAEGLGIWAIGPHLFPEVWQPGDWIVPRDGERLWLQYPTGWPREDRRLSGPVLFCCLKAYDLHRRYFPQPDQAEIYWQLADAAEIKTWLDQGVRVIYFAFCDPVRPEGLLVLGFEGERLWHIVTKRQPIELYAPYADRMR